MCVSVCIGTTLCVDALVYVNVYIFFTYMHICIHVYISLRLNEYSLTFTTWRSYFETFLCIQLCNILNIV